MATYWDYSIHYSRPDGSSGGVGAAGKDLGDAVARIIRDATYYVGLGYSVSLERLEECCSRCSGEGELSIRRPRSRKIIRCPDCKGKARQHSIPAVVALTMPSCVSVVNDAA